MTVHITAVDDREAGRLALARYLAVMEARERINRPQCTIRSQVPDVDVFGPHERMPRFRRMPPTRNRVVLSEPMRQGACWVEPAVPVAVKVWRWV